MTEIFGAAADVRAFAAELWRIASTGNEPGLPLQSRVQLVSTSIDDEQARLVLTYRHQSVDDGDSLLGRRVKVPPYMPDVRSAARNFWASSLEEPPGTELDTAASENGVAWM